MSYSALKTAIAQVIKSNGAKEITGPILQAQLFAMIDSLGAGFQFMGVATPATSPGTPDQKVMYIAGVGTYPNFGGTVINPGSIGVFTYNGSWTYDTIGDISPAYININELANHPAAYADAATALADVPQAYRRTGVKVVYLDNTQQTWIEMLCVDDAGPNWWTDVANNWIIEGPIETKIVTPTGGQQLRIAGEKRGNLDDVLNVNVWNEQATEYATQAAARAAVPANKRKLGAIITYLVSTGTDTSGWMIDEFIGSSISDWTVADNWKIIGPVSVIQNTNTNGQILKIGELGAGSLNDFFNVNAYRNKNDAYEDAAHARIAIPLNKRSLGMNITYLLSDGWHIEQFVGTVIDDHWYEDTNWTNNINDIPILCMAPNCIYNDDDSISFQYIAIKRGGYKEKWQTVSVNSTVYPLSGEFSYVLTAGNNVVAKASDNISYKDIILLRYDSNRTVIGGALYADYILQKKVPKYNDFVVSVSSTTTYNDDGSIYFGSIMIENRLTGEKTSLNINSTLFPASFSTAYAWVLQSDNVVTSKLLTDIDKDDLILLVCKSTHEPTGGPLYADYINKRIVREQLTVSKSTVYNDDGSIYFGSIVLRTKTGIQIIQFNNTYTPTISGSSYAWVLGTDNVISTKLYDYITTTDVVLLACTSDRIAHGGVLYADYIRKKDNQTYYGKKLLATGASDIYGSTVSDRNAVFPVLVANKLGMSVVNYGIGGSTYAKRATDYDDVFLVYQDWLDAISAGILDTQKKYLVKDNINIPTRPYHIYTYDNGDWVASGDASYQCGRTPLVDRISEMDTDGDVIIIGCGQNDWAYLWDDLGQDSDRVKTTFYGALHLICQYLTETYHGAIVIFINLQPSWRYQPQGISQATWNMTTWNAVNPNGKTWNDFVEATKTVLRQYGYEFWDIGAEMGFSQNDRWWCGDTDGKYCHVNEAGQLLLADRVAAKLLSMKK